MFENYIAKTEDFRVIEEGIDVVWKKELNFIFRNKKLIKNVIVISYDSKNLYLWSKVLIPKLNKLSTNKNGYNFYQIPHKIKIRDEDQRGWRVGSWIGKNEIEKYLPKKISVGNYQYPKIIGSLLEPFIKSHNKKTSAYYSRESYLATIVHEFGHIYFNQYKTWWYSNKNENLKYLKVALNLYSAKKTEKLNNFRVLLDENISEVFAFCTDYSATNLFWLKHKQDIDRINKMVIKDNIKKEQVKNLDIQNSVLDGFEGSHLLAMTLGKILINYFPNSWPKKILSIGPKIGL